MIVKMQLLEPVSAASLQVPDAVLIDRVGRIICGWQVTEPGLRAQFEARDFAFFEVRGVGNDWEIVRRVPDQDW
jgi:hypothetical protein